MPVFTTDRPVDCSQLAWFFSCFEDIAAAFPMDVPWKNGVARVAVVSKPGASLPFARLSDEQHDLELETGTLFDLLWYPFALAPRCTDERLAYIAEGSPMPDGEMYVPYNEEDPLNQSKLDAITEFADVAEKDPGIIRRLSALASADGSLPKGDPCRVHDEDWRRILADYPLDMQLRFFRSDANHLKEIAASSPILRFARSWRADAL